MNDTYYGYKCLKYPNKDGRYEDYNEESRLPRLRYFNLVFRKYVKSNKPVWF